MGGNFVKPGGRAIGETLKEIEVERLSVGENRYEKVDYEIWRLKKKGP